MSHTHTWKKSKRVHKRPPRFFVACECGEERQAVMRFGYLHTFTTNHKRGRMDNYSIRLPRKPTKTEVKQIQDLIKNKPPE
jgi:hypothetical protein